MAIWVPPAAQNDQWFILFKDHVGQSELNRLFPGAMDPRDQALGQRRPSVVHKAQLGEMTPEACQENGSW